MTRIWEERLRVTSKNIKSFVQRGPNGTARLFVYIGVTVALATLLYQVQAARDDLHTLVSGEISVAQAVCPAKANYDSMIARLRAVERHVVADERTDLLLMEEVRLMRATQQDILLRLSQ